MANLYVPLVNWSLTSYADPDTILLQLDDPLPSAGKSTITFQVSSFQMAYALNEIPTARVTLPVGRKAGNIPAAIHGYDLTDGPFAQMTRATIFFAPKGGYSPKDVWPDEGQIIFRGFVAGTDEDKRFGRSAAAIQLIGWPAGLTFSSCLSYNAVPTNPADMTTAAVMRTLSTATGASNQANISTLTGLTQIDEMMRIDFWSGLKTLFSKLAEVKATASDDTTFVIKNADGTTPSIRNNQAALDALSRIEGPGTPATARDYLFGIPLPLTAVPASVQENVSGAIAEGTLTDYANSTFWNKLVATIAPTFGLTFVPGAEYGLLVPDCPTWSGPVWRELGGQYVEAKQATEISVPLRAVGVFGITPGITGLNTSNINLGGSFAADSQATSDGLIQYVQPPKWLSRIPFQAGGKSGPDLKKLYDSYARMVYSTQVLKGRSVTIQGPIRFDIAPGSHVQFGTAENVFNKGQGLSGIRRGCVSRVTIEAGTDPPSSSCTINLTHVRSASETEKSRFTTPNHPLFGDALISGAPLVPAWANLEE